MKDESEELVLTASARIGVSGHQRLPEVAAWVWVRQQIDVIVERTSPPVVGVTSLAAGSDQVFAESVLAHRGTLEVVVPFPEYERTFVADEDRIRYLLLLGRAVHTVILPRIGSDEESYYTAGKLVVDSTNSLLAVWDGAAAKGLGGTGDVVAYALRVGKPVVHIDPIRQQISSI